MVGSIDPDASKSVGPIGRTQVAWLIGTRIAETILASGQTHRINRPDIWTQAIRSPIKKLLCHGGRPHMGPRLRGDDIEFAEAQTATSSSAPGGRSCRCRFLAVLQ